jgi:predicted RNA-binding protein with PUA-like domain
LVKSEPGTYAWAQLVRDGRTAWTGVRNFAARLHLRAMQPGEPVLFYHSGEAREIVGLAQVARAAYPDPTARAGDWSCVDLAADRPLPKPLGLAAIKADAILKDMVLVKNSRLSVQPVTAQQFNRVLQLAGAQG